MEKKLLSLLLFSGLLGIFSCFCEEELPYWNFNDLETSFSDSETLLAVQDTFEGDTLQFVFYFTPTFLAESTSFQNPFISSAMAFSCPPNGGLGMKDPLTSMKIYSDADFNDLKAGEDLTPLLVGKGNVFNLENCLKGISDSEYQSSSSTYFYLAEKPLNNSTHTFRVVFEFESKRKVEKTMDTITWK